jgi:hypothetical protein
LLDRFQAFLQRLVDIHNIEIRNLIDLVETHDSVLQHLSDRNSGDCCSAQGLQNHLSLAVLEVLQSNGDDPSSRSSASHFDLVRLIGSVGFPGIHSLVLIHVCY